MIKNYASKHHLLLTLLLLFIFYYSEAQHTFSIVAVDPATGEIGSAGATCLDIDDLNGEEGALVVSDIVLGTGAINTQSAFTFNIQAQARARMLAGDAPSQILSWLAANDGGHQTRQYTIVDLPGGVGGTPRTDAFTGSSNGNYANHIIGSNYAIAGNILLNQDVLDDMETNFNSTSGTLADKLMAALQGAKRVGAQTSCSSNNTSSKSAYLRVAKVNDLYNNYGHLTVDLNVSRTNTGIDPIDVLQTTYDFYKTNPGFTCSNTVNTFPYIESFETDLGLWEQNDYDLSHINNTDFDWTRNSGNTTSNATGPSTASDGNFYLYTEASNANVGYPTKRAVLNSPCIDLTGVTNVPTLNFDYHMLGTDIGNMSVRINDGTGWKTVWLLNGPQGNQWFTASIDLTPYVGSVIQIRMDSTTGTGFSGDVAIDNISITLGGLLNLDEPQLNVLNIYPNPVQKNLTIILDQNNSLEQLQIFDILGKQVLSQNVTAGRASYQLNLEELEQGMYILKMIQRDNTIKLFKVIKRY